MLITTNQDLRSDKKPSVRVDSMKSGSARAVVEGLELVDSEQSHGGKECFH